MKTTKPRLSLQKGFTLIELLVVIAIIAVLAGLGFGGFTMARNKANELQAQKAISDLVAASNDFYNEYNFLPLGSQQSNDTVQTSDRQLMTVLMGKQQGATENPKLIRFFEGQRAKGSRIDSAYAGVFETDNDAVLFGPWRLSQREQKLYRVIYDYNYDKIIEEQEGIGNQTIRGMRQIVYHFGPDGQAGQNMNDDNIYSYKPN